MSAGSLLPEPPPGFGPGIHAAKVSRLDPFAVTLDNYGTTYESAATWVAAGQVPARGDRVLAVIDDAAKVWAFPAEPAPPGETGATGATGAPGATGPAGPGGGMPIWADGFAVDQLASQYTVTPGGGAVVSGGVLKVATADAATLVTKNASLATGAYTARDMVAQVKCNRGATSGNNSTSFGFAVSVMSPASTTDLFLAQWQWFDGASAAALALYYFEAGSYSTAGTTGGLARPSAGDSFWLRLSRTGNAILLDYYTATPDIASGLVQAPTATVVCDSMSTARSARFGQRSRPMPFGLYANLPSTTDWSIDDFTVWP